MLSTNMYVRSMLITINVDVVYISRRVHRREQNSLSVRIGKSEAEVINNLTK